MKLLVCAAAAAGLATTTLLTSPAVAAPGDPVVVTRNLDNPRQLGLTSDRTLVIAESGRGGSDCVGGTCVGTTGAVSIVRRPSKADGAVAERVVTGLLSEAGPSGNFAGGNDSVSARSLNEIYVAKDVDIPAGITGLPAEQSGKLLRAASGQSPTVVADIRAFEDANDPDGQGVESNPYAVLDLGNRVLVADAAGNDILAVDDSGRISVFAVLPNITGGACDSRANQGGNFCDPVPTALTLSRDGDIIVGGLGSLVPNAGRVWEMDSRTGAIQNTWTGFTGVTGAAQDQAGNLYVSELRGGGGTGQVVFVPKNGERDALPVPSPAGVVVDQPGNVYVAANSTSAGTGQVWRLTKQSFA
jgi:hypothetical protein